MNPLQIVALLVLVVLCASGLWRASHQAPARKMVKVIAAGRDIPCNSSIGFMMLKYISIPADLADKEMLVSLNAIVGRQARTFLPAGEPIRRQSFFASKEGISANLKSDERAITLQLTDDQMLDHVLAPDDLVDVIAVGNKNGNKYAKTICQHVRVLTAPPREQLTARKMGGSSNKITLAVSAGAAELVSEAVDMGKIRLVLRGRYNNEDQVLSGAGPEDVLPDFVTKDDAAAASSASEKAAVLPPPPAVASEAEAGQSAVLEAPPAGPVEWVVEMISGSHKEQLSVPRK